MKNIRQEETVHRHGVQPEDQKGKQLVTGSYLHLSPKW